MKESTLEILSQLVCLDDRHAHTADLMRTTDGFTLSSSVMNDMHGFHILIFMDEVEQSQDFYVHLQIDLRDLTVFSGLKGRDEYLAARLLQNKFLESDFYQNYLAILFSDGKSTADLTFTNEDEFIIFAQATIEACGQTFYNSNYSKVFYTIRERKSEIKMIKSLLTNEISVGDVKPFDYISDKKFTFSFDTSELYCNTCLSIFHPQIITLGEYRNDYTDEKKQRIICESCGMTGMVDDWVTLSNKDI